MNNIVKQIEYMYEMELFDNAIQLCDMLLTAADQKMDLLSASNRCLLNFYYANALYEKKQYGQAEVFYNEILQYKKGQMKTLKINQKQTEHIVKEINIKYKLYLCYIQMKQRKKAIDILQGIPSKQRTAAINMALGNLYRISGIDRSAITCYKEVLKDCPLAIKAAEALLQLGVNGADVNSLTLTATNEVNWLNLWLKAQAQLCSKDYMNALVTYKSMDTHGLLKDNTLLLLNIANCYHFMCEDEKSVAYLKRALNLNPNISTGRDLLASILTKLFRQNKDYGKYLDALNATTLLQQSNNNGENDKFYSYIVLGNNLYVNRKLEKALHFAQKSIQCEPQNVEGYLLKARILNELHKHEEAANHCSFALQLITNRFDIYECLVDSYIKMNRLHEAEVTALNACQILNHNPHCLTLHATVLLKNSITPRKTIYKILEKAVEYDKNCNTNAIYLMLELMMKDQKIDQAKQLILNYVDVHPTSRLHRLLGDCYIQLQNEDEAFNHYNIALRLDPDNHQANEGLNNIGRKVSTSTYKKDAYYSCVDDGCNNVFQGRNSDDVHVPVVDDDVFGDESDDETWPSNNNFDMQ